MPRTIVSTVMSNNGNASAIENYLSEWERWAIDSPPKVVKFFTEGSRHLSYLIEDCQSLYVLRANKTAVLNTSSPVRQHEQLAHTAASELGISPEIIYNDPHAKYRVCKYISGETLQSDLSKHSGIPASDVKSLCEIVSQYQTSSIDLPIIDYEKILSQYHKRLSDPPNGHRLDEAQYKAMLTNLEALASLQKDTPTVLSHHDLNPANIVRLNQNPHQKNTKFFILDWEYACQSFACMDFAILTVELNIPFDEIASITEHSAQVLDRAAVLYRDLCQLYAQTHSSLSSITAVHS